MTNKSSAASRIMVIIAAVLCAAAICSYFLPMISFWGDVTGFELFDWLDWDEEGIILLIPLVCAGLGLLFAGLANIKRKLAVGTTVTSAIGFSLMLVLFLILGELDVAGIGFYVYMGAELSAFVLSIIGVAKASSGDVPDDGIDCSAYRCPNCHSMNAPGATFCGYCGASLMSVPTPPVYTPPVPPVYTPPVVPPVVPPAVPPVIPNPYGYGNPVPDKSKRTAICPKCGAKQYEGTINCKYCGTYMLR